jgi:hypothetical protein
MIALLLVALAAAMPAGIKQDLKTLRTSHVREKVAEAAVRIAGSDDPVALRELGDLLATRRFLARLDDLNNPQLAIINVHAVFRALEARPSSTAEALCLRVAPSADFAGDGTRTGFALQALAAVRPMSAEAEALFRKTNGEGSFNSNLILLAANGSERAVALLESMFADRSQRADDRASMTHESIVPNRTNVSIVRMVDRLWEQPVEREVLLALAESIFAYNPEWYGKRRNPPVAPDWSTAPREAREAAAALGRKLSKRGDLPASLRAAIQAATRS